MHTLAVFALPLFVRGTAYIWWISPLVASGTVLSHDVPDFTAWIEARGFSLETGILKVGISPEDAVECKIRWV